ncbi:hypothetical protein Cni_G25743 [Canna indica]|uniref:Uncharacterized protein n=1 Tax=Canna indica TaxID=4628 RepID=A0AAQ3KYG5_9LILI|nr:hypothetical protein Cni_G25743 [Canna indica]
MMPQEALWLKESRQVAKIHMRKHMETATWEPRNASITSQKKKRRKGRLLKKAAKDGGESLVEEKSEHENRNSEPTRRKEKKKWKKGTRQHHRVQRAEAPRPSIKAQTTAVAAAVTHGRRREWSNWQVERSNPPQEW